MMWLTFIPRPMLLAMALLGFGAAAVQTVRVWACQRTMADVRGAVAAGREQQAKDALAAEIKARAEEQRRQRIVDEAIDDAHLQTARARADAVRADRAAGELRSAYLAVAEYATRQAGRNPAAAPGSQATAGPGLVLAQLFSRVDPQLRELAAAVDQARIAGLACERAYDGLRAP